MRAKPSTRDGYGIEQVASVHRTCLYMATKLGDLLDASPRGGEPSCHSPGGTPYGASAKRAVAAFRGQVCPPSV